MSGKIRVLVVDDSVVVRRMLSEMLAADPAIESISTASNGKIALARIPQINPDAIILDVEMPELDGLQTLAAVRRIYKTLPVIMFSTVTARGASATLDALALGANDYVTKPSARSGTVGQLNLVYKDLVAKIRAHCRYVPILPDAGASDATVSSTPTPAPSIFPPLSTPGGALPLAKPEVTGPADAIAIGVSTGGPNALAELLPTLPANLPVPVFIVQHMPRLFTKLLAERLSSKTRIPVHEACLGDQVSAGNVYIAPGDYHMLVKRIGMKMIIETNQAPPENSCRPAVDPLFRSVAEAYGSKVVAVVLTGMGQDGLRGCEAIRARGGQVLAQDEASSVVWGMPGFVARAGLAERVIPLAEMGPEIVRRVRKPETVVRVQPIATLGANP
ncbi:MAG TPA: chemotaxis response regulator protein-glutamate methylesterase [Candidatus Binataceae bacterium]|nr:chemotaxis response regulator protein-glutamate methylesterase [Candidatus Binataceae bacterium]